MAGTQLTRARSSSVASFEVLVRKVHETLLLGQQRIEQEKVRTYWKAGRDIQKYFLLNKKRADLGDRTLEKLGERIDVDPSVLQRCKQFVEKYPVFATWQKLTWSHFRLLIPIADDRVRMQLTERAEREGWVVAKLESVIRNELRFDSKNGGAKLLGASGENSNGDLLRPRLGSLYTYRIIRPEKIHPGRPELEIDLGFSDSREAAGKGSGNLKAGDIVTSVWVRGDTYRLVKASGKTETDLFTYYAFVERIVDADTLLVWVDLGFGMKTRQYLRLRGIDAPEVDTDAGRKAKAFAQSLVKEVPFIFLTSTRSDKYDRYLADVFVPGKEFLKEWTNGTATLSKSNDLLFLNNELIRRRFAVQV